VPLLKITVPADRNSHQRGPPPIHNNPESRAAANERAGYRPQETAIGPAVHPKTSAFSNFDWQALQAQFSKKQLREHTRQAQICHPAIR